LPTEDWTFVQNAKKSLIDIESQGRVNDGYQCKGWYVKYAYSRVLPTNPI